MKIEYYSANPESPASGYWDQALLSDILSHGIFERIDSEGGAIVVIPGPYQAGYINKINDHLGQFLRASSILDARELSSISTHRQVRSSTSRMLVLMPSSLWANTGRDCWDDLFSFLFHMRKAQIVLPI